MSRNRLNMSVGDETMRVVRSVVGGAPKSTINASAWIESLVAHNDRDVDRAAAIVRQVLHPDAASALIEQLSFSSLDVFSAAALVAEACKNLVDEELLAADQASAADVACSAPVVCQALVVLARARAVRRQDLAKRLPLCDLA